MPLKLSLADYKKVIARATVYLSTTKKKTAKELLKYVEASDYLPDPELADAIEQTSEIFRRSLKLEPK